MYSRKRGKSRERHALPVFLHPIYSQRIIIARPPFLAFNNGTKAKGDFNSQRNDPGAVAVWSKENQTTVVDRIPLHPNQ